MQEAHGQEEQSYRESGRALGLPSTSTTAQPSMGRQVPKIHQLSRISEIQNQADIRTKSPQSTKSKYNNNGQIQNVHGGMLAQVSRTNR